MMIISNSSETSSRIQNSWDRIIENVDKSIEHEMLITPLIITDSQNAKSIYDDPYGIFMRAYNESFGAMKGSIDYEGNRYHLVVINVKLCKKINLTEDQFDGVLSHELGHIFNEYPSKPVPNYMQTPMPTKAEISEVRNENSLNSELYADYFSKIAGVSGGLIASIEHFQNSRPKVEHDLFDKRLEKLRGNEKFIGQTLTIKQVGVHNLF